MQGAKASDPTPVPGQRTDSILLPEPIQRPGPGGHCTHGGRWPEPAAAGRPWQSRWHARLDRSDGACSHVQNMQRSQSAVRATGRSGSISCSGSCRGFNRRFRSESPAPARAEQVELLCERRDKCLRSRLEGRRLALCVET